MLVPKKFVSRRKVPKEIFI